MLEKLRYVEMRGSLKPNAPLTCSPGRERDPRDFIPRTDGKSRQHGSSADGKSRQHGSSAGYDKLPIVHISCTHNNTILTITDHTGKVLAWTSAVSHVPINPCFDNPMLFYRVLKVSRMPEEAQRLLHKRLPLPQQK